MENAQDIREAVKNGKKVYWKNKGYEVITDSKNQWFIKCEYNNHCIGLTWRDGETLNGDINDFFISDEC